MINGGPINGAAINALFEPPFIDWSVNVDPLTTQTYYACEIDDGVLDPIRPPISSWQATLQVDRSDFVQAVIPAAIDWVTGISARQTSAVIRILRGARFEDGSEEEAEMARVPLQVLRLQRGPNRTTITISGYQKSDPTPARLRALRDVRSLTIDPNIRVRCAIDWFLRPGHIAQFDSQQFTVAYINYYVNESDQYMDVGERAL